MIGPVAVDGAAVSIRRSRQRTLPLAAFTSIAVVELLTDVMRARCNVVVSGATSSGKTSLLAALLSLTEPAERIIVLEDTAELQPTNAHVVRLEARPTTPDGIRPIPLDELVRTALRLRPDRLVVGEVRGNEVTGLVQAMNTGHDGSLATCHANGPIDALLRLETLVMQAAPSWPLAAIRAQLTRSIDVIVHVARTAGAARQIVDIVEVGAGDGPPAARPLVSRRATSSASSNGSERDRDGDRASGDRRVGRAARGRLAPTDGARAFASARQRRGDVAPGEPVRHVVRPACPAVRRRRRRLV